MKNKYRYFKVIQIKINGKLSNFDKYETDSKGNFITGGLGTHFRTTLNRLSAEYKLPKVIRAKELIGLPLPKDSKQLFFDKHGTD